MPKTRSRRGQGEQVRCPSRINGSTDHQRRFQRYHAWFCRKFWSGDRQGQFGDGPGGLRQDGAGIDSRFAVDHAGMDAVVCPCRRPGHRHGNGEADDSLNPFSCRRHGRAGSNSTEPDRHDAWLTSSDERVNEPELSEETAGELNRVGRILGAAEGTGPDSDPFLRRQRGESHAAGWAGGMPRAERRRSVRVRYRCSSPVALPCRLSWRCGWQRWRACRSTW